MHFPQTLRLVVLVLASAAALGASAQVDGGLPDLPMPQVQKLPTSTDFADQQMRAFDRNRDGKVTWEEFSAKLRKAFDDMDRSHKGYLSRADLKASYEHALASVPRPQPVE